MLCTFNLRSDKCHFFLSKIEEKKKKQILNVSPVWITFMNASNLQMYLNLMWNFCRVAAKGKREGTSCEFCAIYTTVWGRGSLSLKEGALRSGSLGCWVSIQWFPPCPALTPTHSPSQLFLVHQDSSPSTSFLFLTVYIIHRFYFFMFLDPVKQYAFKFGLSSVALERA